MGFDGDGEEDVHQALTADLLGSAASQLNDLPPKRGRGRPKAKGGTGPAKPTPSGDPSGQNAGQDGKKKTNEKKCLACPRPVSDPRRSCWCDLDKRALDRLRFMCKQKSPELKEWFAGVMKNPAQTVEMLNNYWTSCGGRAKFEKAGASPLNPKWSIVEFKESLRSESGVHHLRRGMMMWEKQFVEWCQTAEGGKYSEEEAQGKWSELLKRKQNGDPDVEFDFEGPRQELNDLDSIITRRRPRPPPPRLWFVIAITCVQTSHARLVMG